VSEELKIIMETIGQLGQAGKEAFIWWLLMKYLLHYATVGLFIVVAGFSLNRLISAIRTHQDECKLVAEIAAKSGVRPCNYYDRNEFGKMYEWVRAQKETS
jgi:hypothetical protein